MIGPRQSGKTTLAQIYVPSDSLNYFDLEGPVGLIRLEEPMTAPHERKGLAAVDAIQPLFPAPRKFPTSLRTVTKP